MPILLFLLVGAVVVYKLAEASKYDKEAKKYSDMAKKSREEAEKYSKEAAYHRGVAEGLREAEK